MDHPPPLPPANLDPVDRTPIPGVRHGTQRGYASDGCRCPMCTQGHRDSVQYYARKKAGELPPSSARTARPQDTAALECTCGGLLAEDNDGHVYCLACEGVPQTARA